MSAYDTMIVFGPLIILAIVMAFGFEIYRVYKS